MLPEFTAEYYAAVLALADRLPSLRIVINHIGMLPVTGGALGAEYDALPAECGARPNIFMKVSGTMEGEWHRLGPNRVTWPSVLSENLYRRPVIWANPVRFFAGSREPDRRADWAARRDANPGRAHGPRVLPASAGGAVDALWQGPVERPSLGFGCPDTLSGALEKILHMNSLREIILYL